MKYFLESYPKEKFSRDNEFAKDGTILVNEEILDLYEIGFEYTTCNPDDGAINHGKADVI